MSLTPVGSQLGKGGTGLSDGHLRRLLTEAQGLNFAVLDGVAENTKIDVAAIRPEDTILALIESNAGVLTDRTANASIVDSHATGTLTGDTVIATDEVEVAGMAYVFQAAAPTAYGQVQIGEDDDESMANLADAINAYEASISRGGAQVVATVDAKVVTVTAVAQGAAGNALTLTSEDATITASGSGTLAGGTDTGGIKVDVATTDDSLLLVWINKQ